MNVNAKKVVIASLIAVSVVLVVSFGVGSSNSDVSPPSMADTDCVPGWVKGLSGTLEPLSPKVVLDRRQYQVAPRGALEVAIPKGESPLRMVKLRLSKGSSLEVVYGRDCNDPDDWECNLELPVSGGCRGSDSRVGTKVVMKEGGRMTLRCRDIVLPCVVDVVD
jgi:hypothetical protein